MFLLSPSIDYQLYAKKAVEGPTPPSSTPSILVPSDIAASHAFGSRVDVSNDTMIVTSPGFNSGAGAVYVFVKSGGTWSQQARLTPSDSNPSIDAFAEGSISISGDTVAIAAKATSTTAAVYIFVRSGTTWTQQTKITNFGGFTVASASSVLVNNNELFVGNSSDAIYCFTRSGTTWTYRTKIDNPTVYGAGSGWGSTLARYNTSLLSGALNSDIFGTNVGVVGVFNGSAATYTPGQTITGPTYVTNEFFGQTIHNDGATLVVGAPLRTQIGLFSGGAHIFTYDGSLWNHYQLITPTDAAAGDQFGLSCFIKGNRLVVGAPNDDDKGSNAGSVYVYDKTGTTWDFVSKIVPSNLIASDNFGSAVASHNQQVIVGFPKSTYAGAGAGAVYLF